MIDILDKLINGEISVDDVYQIYDEIMDKFDEGIIEVYPQAELCMNKYEWTAFAHGAALEVIADWRRNGWPKKCGNCNKSIDYTKYGWFIKANKLKCLKCNE